MAITKVNLDRQTDGRLVTLGNTGAGTEALLTLNKGTAAVTTVVLDIKGSATVAGDLNLTGNLNITGNVNTQSVTNTNIADITITLNDGGTTASAAGAGLFIEGDSNTTIGKLLFDNTLTSKFKIGDGTTQVEVVTISGAQTLTNKTIGGGQISGNIGGNAANVTGTVLVANGGTGMTTTTPYALFAAGTTATGNHQQVSGLGTSGWVLTSNGAGALPTWQAIATSTFGRWTTVSGTQDSSNKTFTIANALSASSEIVVVNGVVLDSGASNDYVLSGTTLTFQAGFTAPAAGDKIKVYGNY
jgi:hypothetical protein